MKKIIFFSLPLLLAGAFFFTETAFAEEITIDNSAAVESAETSEAEPQVAFDKTGTLLEIGSTDIPTQLILRTIVADYTVDITADTLLGQRRDQLTKLEHWIPGDSIRVVGTQNANSGVVAADMAINRSIVTRYTGFNGWVKEIDIANNRLVAEWGGKRYTLQISDKTRINARGKNPGTINNFKVDDRIRARVVKRVGSDVLDAEIIIVLRYGNDLYMKVRTWATSVELVSLAGTSAPTTMVVKVLESPTLRKGDVNNLVGAAGTEKTVNITADTKIVRRYLGRATLDEFTPGDHLVIVGRLNDDGTITAKLVKNNFLWLVSTKGSKGVVVDVKPDDRYFTLSWEGKEFRVSVDAKTKIKRLDLSGEKDATLADIKVGDFVRGFGVRRAQDVLARGVVIVPKAKAARNAKIRETLRDERIEVGEIED